MLQKFYFRAYVQVQNVKDRVESMRESLVSERGEWLGSLAWTGIYGIGAIAVALAIGVALTALGGRVSASIGSVDG